MYYYKYYSRPDLNSVENVSKKMSITHNSFLYSPTRNMRNMQSLKGKKKMHTIQNLFLLLHQQQPQIERKDC